MPAEYDKLLELCSEHPDNPASPTNVGWAYLRKGDLDKAIEVLSEDIESAPRSCVAYHGRAWAHLLRGELASALSDTLRDAELNPAWGGAWCLRLIYGRDAGVFAAHWDAVDAICAAAIRRKARVQSRYLSFRALACLNKERSDPDLALDLATQAVTLAEDGENSHVAEALGCLGEVHFGRGDVAEAIRTLERAERLPQTWGESSRELAQYRRLHFPRLASCDSVDAYLRGDIHGDIEDPMDPLADLARVREAFSEGPREARAYLEASLLEREGRIAEALQIAEGLLAGDARAEPALVLAAAGWMAKQGRVEAALEIIEGRFAAGENPSLDPWVAWARIGSEGGLGLPELSDRIARALADASPAADGTGAAADMRWLLEELRTQGVVRLNCGGPDYVDASGKPWGRDRFFDGGEAYGNPRPDMEIQEDRDLYYDHRRFLHGDWVRNAYRVPIPAGLYELALRFSAIDRRPEARSFRLAVEGTTIRECVDLVEDPGIGRALVETLKVRVTDGALDILLEPLPGSYAVVNAIELRLLSEGDGGQ